MKMIIGGEKVDSFSGKTIDIINPATGEFLDTIPAATKEDVDRALDLSKIGFKKWGKTTLMQREAIFNKFCQLVDKEENYKWFMKTLALEAGKSPKMTHFEIGGLKELFKGYLETAKRYDGKVLVPGTEVGHDGHTEKDLVMLVHEPVGTVVSIIPFNAPLMLFGYKVAPALAAGNAVIVKPPTDNPSTCIRAVELLHEAGVPGEALQIITGRGSDLGNLLIDDPRIDAITMTGSTEIGIEIAKSMAKHLRPCSLELGGNDAFIVMPDADLDEVVPLCAFGRTGNAGQVCISPKRFLIHRDIIDKFTEKVLELIKLVEWGFPEDVDAAVKEAYESGSYTTSRALDLIQMCSIINEKAAIEVEKQVQHTIDQGAKLVYGGKRHGAFFEPTVLVNVTKDMDVAKDMEIFGPVIPLISFDTFEEAMEIANQSIYGLAGCIFTADWKLGMRAAQEMQTGEVIVNGTGLFRNMMQPFGGYKQSGMGKEGFVTLGEMMEEKTVVFKGFLR